MASSINASTSGAGGVITTADNTGILNLQTASTTAVTVDASQNVGIGTTSPSTYSAKFAIKTSDQDVIGFVGGTTYGMRFGANSSFAVIDGVDAATGTSAYNPLCMRGSQLLFNTAGTERMRIDSSGNVIIGTTTSYGRLTSIAASNSTRAAGILSQSSGDVANEAMVVGKYDNNTTTSQKFITFTINNSAAGSGQINANGANAAAFGSYSDARLKENIEPLPPQLNNILALKPSEFDYKDGLGHQIGFIAQEMQEVYPDVVGEGSDGMLTITGWSKTEARLVKAIQEQQTIINDLKARIETLEAK